ncbi:hypothetical protein BDA96_10G118500, partial [Sorghum bicolor]
TEFLGHCPASTVAAAMLCTVTEIPGMSCIGISPETEASWCTGLTEEQITSRYQLLQQLAPMTRRKILASEFLSQHLRQQAQFPQANDIRLMGISERSDKDSIIFCAQS